MLLTSDVRLPGLCVGIRTFALVVLPILEDMPALAPPRIVVLGVTGEYKSDFDNAPVNQTVLVAATSPANAPITGVLRGYLTTKDSNSGYKMQLYMECSLPSERGSLFMRALGSGSWTNWERISYDVPTFYKDYSTLAELKAALDAV